LRTCVLDLHRRPSQYVRHKLLRLRSFVRERSSNMLDVATRAAGGLARSLVVAAFGAAGTVIGGMLGLLWGFVNEDGLLQGVVVGAVTGALVSVELADSLLRIWTCGDCSMDERIKRTVRFAGRHVGDWIAIDQH
uniref:YMGG-like Gly-zipper domain-containing protein n=2 Tax=Aegilops tauschii subsp. strangulata TaxID=200361 RepID=A0A453LHI7_AEGTS